MLVAIEMTDTNTGARDLFDLRLQLAAHLGKANSTRRVLSEKRRRVAMKSSFTADEAGNLLSWENRRFLHQRQMDADIKGGNRAANLERVFKRPAISHHRGRGQDAMKMSVQDPVIDFLR